MLPSNYQANDEIEITHPFNLLQPRFHVKETHENLTDKIFRAVESVYKRFPAYDWYYISDDDAYVNVNNLKEFLREKNSTRPVTYGFEFKASYELFISKFIVNFPRIFVLFLKAIVDGGYHSGGPGYVVSGEAFRRLGKKLVQDYKGCSNTGIDDVDVNDCLRKLGTVMEKSIDDLGRQRWLCLSLIDFWKGNFPDWLILYSRHPIQKVHY